MDGCLKPSFLLRAASVLSLLYFAGHTFGAPWTPSHGPETTALVATMKSYRFDFMGFDRTYWDFYFGFGLIISIHLFVQTVVLWQLGALVKNDAARIRSLIALFFLAVVGNAVLAGTYFFVVPLGMAAAIAVCLGWAFIAARSSPA